MPKNNLTYRIGQLEKNYEDLDEKIDLLLQNHLPHLSKKMASLRTEVRVFAVVNVGALIVGIIVAKMFL